MCLQLVVQVRAGLEGLRMNPCRIECFLHLLRSRKVTLFHAKVKRLNKPSFQVVWIHPIHCLILDRHFDTYQELQKISEGIPAGLLLAGFTRSSSDPSNTLQKVIKIGTGFLTCYYYCSSSLWQLSHLCKCSAQTSLAVHSVWSEYSCQNLDQGTVRIRFLCHSEGKILGKLLHAIFQLPTASCFGWKFCYG